MANNGGNTSHEASSTPVDPVTFWAQRSGPIYHLRNYFSGSHAPFPINILHYTNQHVIDGYQLCLVVALAYD